MIGITGLVLIIVGWLYQYAYMKKKKELRKEFLWVYGIGVALLVIDGFLKGMAAQALLNMIVLISVLLVLGKIKK